jgi:hypothetical protein
VVVSARAPVTERILRPLALPGGQANGDELRRVTEFVVHAKLEYLKVAAAPPSLPYKVDTSRPSLRTKWTRLVHPSVLIGRVLSN